MPVKVGLDTTFVVGLLDERDIWHTAAAELQSGLQGGDYQVFVFDCVLSEVIRILILASFDADFDRVPWLKRVANAAGLPAGAAKAN